MARRGFSTHVEIMARIPSITYEHCSGIIKEVNITRHLYDPNILNHLVIELIYQEKYYVTLNHFQKDFLR
jgi:hypothetical protein